MLQPELEEISNVVVMAVENALGPMRERLAKSETSVSMLTGTVTELRAQLSASETKAASLGERLAVAESRLSAPPVADPAVSEVRERVHALETKAANGPERLELPGVTGAAMDALTERVLRLELEPVDPVQPDRELHDRVRSLEMAPDPVDAVLRDQVKGLLLLPERLASIEATVAVLPEMQKSVTETRERQVAMEAKASVTPEPETDVRDHLVALSPVMERIAGIEEQVKGLSETAKRLDVNDRVVALETKAAQPVQEPDADTRERVKALSAVPERLAAIEAQLPLVAEVRTGLAGVGDRLVAVETKQAAPVARVAPDTELRDGLLKVGLTAERLASDLEKVEKRVSEIDTKHAAAVETVTKDLSVMRADVAVAAVRAFTPGPAGASGRDGTDGRDGSDGVSYDELTATLENDRTIVLRAAKGERVKEVGSFKVPFMIHRGIWEAKDYEHGDVVTYGGSAWLCQTPTKAKPGESTDWRLIVKRGDRGKDADPGAPAPMPIVRTR